MFGPDVRSLALTIFLILAPVATFCVFVARKLMDDFSHHLGISIMVISVVFTFYVMSSLSLSLSTKVQNCSLLCFYFPMHFISLVMEVAWQNI